MAHAADQTGKGIVMTLDKPVSDYGPEWRVVSHQVIDNPVGDGSLLLTLVLELRE